MRLYLDRMLNSESISRLLVTSSIQPDVLADALLSRSEGSWIYLHYMVSELERGVRAPIDLDHLPEGLTQYYIRYWQRWRVNAPSWYDVYLPILAALACAQEPVSGEHIRIWSQVRISATHIERILSEEWRPFVAASNKIGFMYRLYHATLRDFTHGRAKVEHLTSSEIALLSELSRATSKMHRRISSYYLDRWGGLYAQLPELSRELKFDPLDDYGISHIAAHLQASSMNELHQLLTIDTLDGRNLWYRVRKSYHTEADFLADLTRAWQLADTASSEGQRSADCVPQARYAMMIASLRGRATNIPCRANDSNVRHQLLDNS